VKDDLIHQMHLAIGGVAAIPKYMHASIAFLQNKPLQADILKEAETILQSEIAPIDDIRGSASYKRLLAKQLFWAHFINLFPDRFSMADLMR
jgi:xanthine dehydrogenase small subunit